MGRYQNSDYAVNKFSEGIVYRFAGQTVEITLEDYLAENPNGTPEEFQRLKEQSDAIYRRQDLDTYNQSRRSLSMQTVEQYADPTEPGFEELCWDKLDSKDILLAYRQLCDKKQLTDVQRRRFELYAFQGQSFREIALLESVAVRAIEQSIYAVSRKIVQIFS